MTHRSIQSGAVKAGTLLASILLAACNGGAGGGTTATSGSGTIQLANPGASVETVNGEAVPQRLLDALAKSRNWDLSNPRLHDRALIELTNFVIAAQAAKDPKTTYSILPERQLTAEERMSFQAVELLDLPKLYAGELEKDAESQEAAPEGPIDPKLATAIVTQLKAMPKQAVERFLEQVDIKRIKDLPAAQWESAKAFLEKLVAEFDAPATTPVEVDPFA